MNILKVILAAMVFIFNDQSKAERMKEKTSCENYAKNIRKYSQLESITLNNRELKGIWTSSSCEAYHGPQFILRKYVIRQDGRWSADYYHFKDGSCTVPTFTVHMSGVFRVGEKNSLGGYQGDFTSRSFLLVPHDKTSLIELLKTAEQYCPKASLPQLQKDRSGEATIKMLKNYTMTKDVYRNAMCRSKFGIHLYTHKLLRILRNKRRSNVDDLLYFGETPTQPSRRSFVPSAYHFPLSRSSSSCKVCKKLESAKPDDVIRLPLPRKDMRIEGEWTSVSCQAVSDTFMSRYLKFSRPDSKGRRTWKLVYYFYLDSSCKVLSYKIAARGKYSTPTKSGLIAGAYNVAFNLTDTEITPYEMLIVELLQAEPEGTCGVSSRWKAGDTQSVKSTQGCRMFRIGIPSIEYDVLKAVKNDDGDIDLYTGQSSTMNIVPNTPDKRPSSFQIPLRRCADVVTGADDHSPRPTNAVKTRKIDLSILKFTIPKEFFLTDGPKKRETEPANSNQDVAYEQSFNSAMSLKAYTNIALVLIWTMLCALYLM
ncbi:protein APCDD1-like isoform X2 [Rhopilema esculentum]|uniref:protein APCDD1-like isoform X2 n=1 Tax=Rhopilema esculentum TaxID=499914 RepID=UPI0031D0844F